MISNSYAAANTVVLRGQFLFHECCPKSNTCWNGGITEIIGAVVMQSTIDGGTVAKPDIGAWNGLREEGEVVAGR